MSADAKTPTATTQTTIGRRQFIKGAATVGAAASTFGPFFPGRVLGANDRVNVAVVGIRGQGRGHVGELNKLPNTRIRTLCDIDENLFAGVLKDHFEAKNKELPGTANDLRKVLDDKDIDAVALALPNHWHALATIWAAQAKKHVYVEKPACHNVWEGRQMVNAARKYNVLVQVGFQNRSRVNTRAAIQFLRDGKLGKVFMARGLCFKARPSIGRAPDGPMPDDAAPFKAMAAVVGPYTKSYLAKVNYDQWMGPAPKKPFNPNRFHYNWHWQWDYGNGDTGNQGPHQFDVAAWGLGQSEYPVKIKSSGALHLYGDTQQETPNTQNSSLEYADGTILEFATRGLPTNAEGDGIRIGVIFYGSEGRLEMDSEGNWKTFMGEKSQPGPTSASLKAEKSDATNTLGSGMGGHFANFIDALRSGKRTELNGEIETCFKTSALPLLANIAYRLKRDLTWDGKKEQFVKDPEANKLLTRDYRKGYAVPSLNVG